MKFSSPWCNVIVTIIISTLAIGTAVAQPSVPQTSPPGEILEADLWLEIQRRGSQASSMPQSVSPAWREKAAERLLRSLDKDIPAPKTTEGFSPGG